MYGKIVCQKKARIYISKSLSTQFTTCIILARTFSIYLTIINEHYIYMIFLFFAILTNSVIPTL